MRKSTSSDDIYSIDPNQLLVKRRKFSIESKKDDNNEVYNEPDSNILSTGNSTFDYFNAINKNTFKFPKVKESFLTNKLRSEHVHNNIEMQTIITNKNINPLHKLSLSKSCELFTKLMKVNKNYNKSHISSSIDFNKNNILPITKFKNNFIQKSLNQTSRRNSNLNPIYKSKEDYYINFLYHKIFPKIFIEHNIKYNVVDNKLNIFYAENEAIFKENMNKRNIMLRKKGQPIKRILVNTNYVKDKLKEVKKKISFLKGVTDYSYPSIILEKVRQKNQIYQLNKNQHEKFLLPYQEVVEQVKLYNKCKEQMLNEAIKIESKCNTKRKNI